MGIGARWSGGQVAASLRVSAAVTTLSTSLRARPEGHSDPNGSRTGSQRAQSGPPEMAQSSQEMGCKIHRVPLARPRSCSGTSVFGRRSVVRPSRWCVGGESFRPLSVRSEVSRSGPSVFGRKRVVRAPQSSVGGHASPPCSAQVIKVKPEALAREGALPLEGEPSAWWPATRAFPSWP